MLLITLSCKTVYRLPADEVLPQLIDKDEAIVDLMFQHYYWLLWANDARYIIGEISERERNSRRDNIMKELEEMK